MARAPGSGTFSGASAEPKPQIQQPKMPALTPALR